MLGESVETSAGDPTRAGKALRVVGTNPFIVGSREEEGNAFLHILRHNPDIKCFILNTGKVGGTDRGQKITVLDSVKILEMLARDKITWERDNFWGYEVPVKIPGVELDRFGLSNFYSKEQIRQLSEDLMRERLEWLARFPGLNKDIISAIKT
jgi:phosphoenolpyruvate carboxykinase (ATP)